LIARGKVFVTEGAVQSRGSTIFALDRSDGHTIWSRTIGGWTNWSTAAYAHGRLFVVNAGGTLEALDADTGRTIWIDLLGGTVTSPPTAAGGIVYVGQDGGRLLAVDAATGSIRWAQPVDGGGDSSPTLSRHGVFVSYSCPQVYAFDRMSGDLRWHHSSSCSGGGGSTSVYHDGRLYVPDLEAPYVLDGRTGALVGSFEATRPPAFAAHVGLFLSGHTLTATDVSTGASLWTFGRHALNTAPIVVNGTAFVGAWSGTLFGVSLTDGAEVWEADVGFHIPAPNQQAFDKPLTGLGAGQGLLVVPAGRHLVAFGGT
jgi:outer membrane protein assembly factor BamB